MKETLKEAAVINYKKLYEGEPLTQDVPIDAFKQGAKWQQQQGYSEEDLEVAFFEGQFGRYSFNDWFEQFKKK